MGLAPTIDITAEDRKTVLELLHRYLPDTNAWVYGSRVKWTSRPQSDLDLVVFATPRQRWQVSDLREAFEESNLPFRVDLFVWDEVPEQFRKQIESEHAVLVRQRNRVPRSGETSHETKRFGDLFSAPPRNGLTRPKAMRGVGTKMVNMGELFAHARLNNVSMDRVPLGRSEAERFLLKKGDLLFARQSLVLEGAGKCSLFLGDDEPVTFESHVTRVRLDQSIASPEYYFYYLQSHHGRSAIRAISEQGAGASGIRGRDLVTLDVLWRPLPEQRAVAHILGTLDDKIELNRQMNETLEEMARALFKSWFVNFDPVHAKATLKRHTTTIPQRGSDWSVERARAFLDSMDPDIAALFPDRFVDSEHGPIPEGWEVRALGECFEVERGLSYKGLALSSFGMPMHNLNSVFEGGGYKSDGIKYYSGDYRPRHVVKPGDVIVANTEQGHDRLLIGFAAIVPKYFGDNGLFSHHTYRVRPKSSVADAPDFVCRLLNTQAIHDTVSRYATGTTVNMLPVDALKIPRFVAPPPQVVTKFSTIAEVARTRQEEFIAESRILVGLRDALLPKLISGNMRVKDQFRR